MIFKSQYRRLNLLLLNMILVCMIFSEFWSTVNAMNAPVTTASIVGTAVPGQQVAVQISVTGFTTIGSVSLSLDYDYSMLHFVSQAPNASINGGNLAVGDNDLGNGKHRLIMGWYNTNSLTLPAGTVLMTYTFTYLSGTPLLEWFDNGPSCSYTDGIGTILSDLPFSSYYNNGMICGAVSSAGLISGPATVNTGTPGVVYTIGPVGNATKYLWSVPTGSSITSGANTNSVTVNYLAGSASGNITVVCANDCGSGPAASLQVTVQDIPTGISETVNSKIYSDITENDFQVYPNPARENFFIRSDFNTNDKYTFSILSFNGTIIKKLTAGEFEGQSLKAFDVSDLKPGLYFVRIKSELINVIKRVIIF